MIRLTDSNANTSGTATETTDRIIYDTNGGQLNYTTAGTSVDTAPQFASLTA